VTPSDRASGAPPRPAWVWMSTRPCVTYLPRASIVSVASPAMLASTAAMRPPEIVWGSGSQALYFTAFSTSFIPVPDLVDPERGIDDVPSLDDEIIGRGEQVGGAGEHRCARGGRKQEIA